MKFQFCSFFLYDFIFFSLLCNKLFHQILFHLVQKGLIFVPMKIASVMLENAREWKCSGKKFFVYEVQNKVITELYHYENGNSFSHHNLAPALSLQRKREWNVHTEKYRSHCSKKNLLLLMQLMFKYMCLCWKKRK